MFHSGVLCFGDKGFYGLRHNSIQSSLLQKLLVIFALFNINSLTYFDTEEKCNSVAMFAAFPAVLVSFLFPLHLGLTPHCAIIVGTVRALKMHGGGPKVKG